MPSTWTARAVQRFDARATVDGVTRPASFDVTSSIYEGHPAGAAREPHTTAALEVAPDRAVTKLGTDPFSRPGSWPPRVGDKVVVEQGDGVDWWQVASGTVSATQGAISTSTVRLESIDAVGDLDVHLIRPALLARMHPAGSSTQWRRPGLCSTWLVDYALRAAGFFATPSMAWECVMSAPMMGSAWPEKGILLDCSAKGNPSAGPATVVTPWGLAMAGITATYLLDASTAVPEVTLNLVGTGSGTMTVSIVDADGVGCFVGQDRSGSKDDITYGIVTGGGTATYRLPRSGSQRVAVRFKRSTLSSQTLTIRTDDGREVTRDLTSTGYPTGWAATRVVVEGSGAVGAVQVANDPYPWSMLGHVPNAVIRIKSVDAWSASRDVSRPVADLLADIADAECSAFWIDPETGVFQWAGRGVLEAQTPGPQLTTLASLDDIGWSDDLQATAQTLYLTRQRPSISQRKWCGINVWEGQGAAGFDTVDTYSEGVNVPEDEDWVGLDTTVTIAGADATRWTIRKGTVTAASQVDPSSEAEAWSVLEVAWTLARTGSRSYEWTANINSASTTNEIALKTPQGSLATNIPPYWRDRAMPIMRSYGLARWSDVTDDDPRYTGRKQGARRYDHDCSWYVQDADRLTELRDHLSRELGSWTPTLSDVPVAPDPTIRLGQRRSLVDPRWTGLVIDVIVLAIRRSGGRGVASQSLTCRVIGWSVSGAPADLPRPGFLQSQPGWTIPA